MKNGHVLAVLIVVAGSSCRDEKDNDSENLSAPTAPKLDELDLDGPCLLEERSGTFVIERYGEFLIVGGSLSDGPPPSTYFEVVGTEGSCKLYQRINPFCDPACSSGEICGLTQECVAYPEPQDLGVVSILGLSEAVQMAAVEPSYKYADASLPQSALVAGSPLLLTTEGGKIEDLELHGIGVEALVLTDENKWVVTPQKGFSLHWDTTEHRDAEIVFRLQIDQHGISPTSLLCDFEDNGEAEVPSAILQQLVNSGVSGFPNATLTRRSSDHAKTAFGCVELMVVSSMPGDIDIAGYVPCVDDDDCEENQVCDLALELCV